MYPVFAGHLCEHGQHRLVQERRQLLGGRRGCLIRNGSATTSAADCEIASSTPVRSMIAPALAGIWSGRSAGSTPHVAVIGLERAQVGGAHERDPQQQHETRKETRRGGRHGGVAPGVVGLGSAAAGWPAVAGAVLVGCGAPRRAGRARRRCSRAGLARCRSIRQCGCRRAPPESRGARGCWRSPARHQEPSPPAAASPCPCGRPCSRSAGRRPCGDSRAAARCGSAATCSARARARSRR